MNIKYKAADGRSYVSSEVSFVDGQVQEVSKEKGQQLLENFPDWFEEVKGSSKAAADDKDDSDQLAPVSSETGANDLSETQNAILNVIRENQPLKITTIAENMGVNWQSLRADVQLLLGSNLISKDYDNQYTLKS